MSNETFQAVTLLALAAELGALIIAWRRRGDCRAALAVNVVIAVAVLFAAAPRIGRAIAEDDHLILALAAFELATLATGIAWFTAPKISVWLVWSEFAVHVLASIAIAIFAFTFKMMRMM